MALRLTYHNGTEQIVVTATDDRTNEKRFFFSFVLFFFFSFGCCRFSLRFVSFATFGQQIRHLAIVNVRVIIIMSIGNTQISILLLCLLYLFVELMITMNEYNFV